MNYNYGFNYEYSEENVDRYSENVYSNDYAEDSNNEEQIRKQIFEAEEELDKWNVLSRNIKDMESAIVCDNNRALERIDNMREISSRGDVMLSQLWEIKASILNNLNRNSYDFNEMFEEEDRSIREGYEEKVNGLYEELRNY